MKIKLPVCKLYGRGAHNIKPEFLKSSLLIYYMKTTTNQKVEYSKANSIQDNMPYIESLAEQYNTEARKYDNWDISKLNYYKVIRNKDNKEMNLRILDSISKDELKKIKGIFGKDYLLKEVGIKRSGGITYYMPYFI